MTARRLVRRLNGLVFLSEALAQRCAIWVPEGKRFVVPNTIDDSLLCTGAEIEVKRARRRAGGSLRLLFFSHMIPSKGYMDVLTAVGLLHERGVDVHADFVGRWDSETGQQAFEEAVRSYGIHDAITYHGGVYDRSTAKALYLNADVFLLPTYYPTEAQPLTVIEAMSAGTPLIVTQHASLPETIREDVEGHFVPFRDPEAIAAAIERLVDYDHWARLSEGARSRFEEVFSPDAVRRQWVELLTSNCSPTSSVANRS